MILKIIISIYLFSLLLCVLYFIIDERVSEKPKGRFGKWWRKYVSEYLDPYDDVYS